MRNILASIIMFMVVGMFTGCESSVNVQEKSKDDSFKITTDKSSFAGYNLVVLKDTKTGREFLSYRDGLVEIKPKGE